MARVTVIVPAHDAEKFLPAALDSVLAQTWPDWRLVIADDASKDGTFSVASAYAERDPRIRVVRLDTNSGPAVARNTAMRAAPPTELVALLDADDYWLPTYIERQIRVLDESRAMGRNVGIVAANALLEEEGQIASDTFAERAGHVKEVSYESMIERNRIYVGSMFLRQAWEDVGGFAPECWGSEDKDLWLRIIEAGYEVVQNEEPTAVYRIHSESLSSNQLTTAVACIMLLERALGRSQTRAHRRAIRSRLRHCRALKARAQMRDALRQGMPLRAAVLAARGTPHLAVAFLQSPSRWREWTHDALTAASRSARRSISP